MHPIKRILQTFTFVIMLMAVCFLPQLHAAEIIPTSNPMEKVVKVFQTDNPLQADLVVFVATNPLQATHKDFIWHFTTNPLTSTVKIFYVDHPDQTTLKIYFTSNVLEAGWKNLTSKLRNSLAFNTGIMPYTRKLIQSAVLRLPLVGRVWQRQTSRA